MCSAVNCKAQAQAQAQVQAQARARARARARAQAQAQAQEVLLENILYRALNSGSAWTVPLHSLAGCGDGPARCPCDGSMALRTPPRPAPPRRL